MTESSLNEAAVRRLAGDGFYSGLYEFYNSMTTPVEAMSMIHAEFLVMLKGIFKDKIDKKVIGEKYFTLVAIDDTFGMDVDQSILTILDEFNKIDTKPKS